MPRPYREVRKDYILARTDTILRGSSGRMNRQEAKESACREFDEMVQQERDIATASIRQERDRLQLELVTQEALDTSSSASVQHYIETGHYLPTNATDATELSTPVPDAVARIVAEAPPLTEAQRENLARIVSNAPPLTKAQSDEVITTLLQGERRVDDEEVES